MTERTTGGGETQSMNNTLITSQLLRRVTVVGMVLARYLAVHLRHIVPILIYIALFLHVAEIPV